MYVRQYDDCKVSLRMPHGNGNLDIVRASYTRQKANETEAYASEKCLEYLSYFSKETIRCIEPPNLKYHIHKVSLNSPRNYQHHRPASG